MAQGEWARRPLVLLGAGGHARSVAAAAEAVGLTILAVHGRTEAPWAVTVLEEPGQVADLVSTSGAVVVPAIGDNAIRVRVSRQWAAHLGSLVAASATVADPGLVTDGTVVLEHAHVGPAATLGSDVIINTGAVVEHDGRVGDGAHIAPGARVLGGASIGAGTLVGAGATILPGVVVGARAVIGAGAVVDRDVAPDMTGVGIPVRTFPTTSRSHGE